MGEISEHFGGEPKPCAFLVDLRSIDRDRLLFEIDRWRNVRSPGGNESCRDRSPLSETQSQIGDSSVLGANVPKTLVTIGSIAAPKYPNIASIKSVYFIKLSI
jgi:hypothetical protein